MYKFLRLIFIILPALFFSQEYLNKNEMYDLQVFHHLDSLTKKDNISVEEYIKFSKPFSKWDIRPTNYEKIWALDSIRTSSEISNFFWGGFSQRYGFTEEQAGDKPNKFLGKAQVDKDFNIKFLNDNLSKFKKLKALIEKSKNHIFLNQNSLQRIDDVYLEKNVYWTYLIPVKSPFPISTRTAPKKKFSFDSLQKDILEKMLEINIYSIVQTEKGIFFILDGFTDNSYGYYFTNSKTMEINNHLFEIMFSKKINDDFYYYIAN